eukprot:6174589-Pleurochrysis_carterae.AAC.4
MQQEAISKRHSTVSEVRDRARSFYRARVATVVSTLTYGLSRLAALLLISHVNLAISRKICRPAHTSTRAHALTRNEPHTNALA